MSVCTPGKTRGIEILDKKDPHTVDAALKIIQNPPENSMPSGSRMKSSPRQRLPLPYQIPFPSIASPSPHLRPRGSCILEGASDAGPGLELEVRLVIFSSSQTVA